MDSCFSNPFLCTLGLRNDVCAGKIGKSVFSSVKYKKVTNVGRVMPKIKPIIMYQNHKCHNESSGERGSGVYTG